MIDGVTLMEYESGVIGDVINPVVDAFKKLNLFIICEFLFIVECLICCVTNVREWKVGVFDMHGKGLYVW